MTDVERVNGWLARFAALVGAPIPPLGADGATRVARGSAVVGVNVLADRGFVLLLAPMPTPDAAERKLLELYRALLEANFMATEDAAFAVDRETGRVYLRALRALDGLDADGFCELLDTALRLADEWDDRLRARFGGA